MYCEPLNMPRVERCRLTLRAAALLALLLLPVGARAADLPYRIATDHYEVSTDVSLRFTELTGQHMEQIYHEYELRFQGYELKRHDRFHVKVFDGRADYEAAVPRELSGSAGGFVSSDRLLAVFREGRTDEEVFRTLYHEGFHQFLFCCMAKDVPLWVNEGFAEYFAEAVWNGERFGTGEVPWRRISVLNKALEDGTFIPLGELVRTTSAAWLAHVRTDETRASLLYCEAWSVVHFLIHGQEGRNRTRLFDYLQAVTAGQNEEEAFRKSFGSDIAAFDRVWRAYVASLQPSQDEVCRKNIEVLAYMAKELYRQPRGFTGLKKLHYDLLENKQWKWEMTTGDGERINSSQKRRVASLFRCPFDRGTSGCSYVLIGNETTGLPELYCLNHAGVVFKAYYVPAGDGRYDVKSERIVRATLAPEIVRKLQAAGR